MDRPHLHRVASDSDSVAAVLAGDRAAFARLYDRYARLIRAVCFDTTSDLNQAQDLCQETFLRAYRKLGELREPEKFAGWLVAIARFVCQEWKRADTRDHHEYVGLAPQTEQPASSIIDAGRDELSQLRRAMAILPDDQRMALHLFYLQEQSAEQARAVLNLSRAGFYKLLERARQHLAKLLASLQEDQT